MPTPKPTWEPGKLERNQRELIGIPRWIQNMMEQNARPFSEECFYEGFFTGWDTATEQFIQADIFYSVHYILEKKGATDDEITVALDSLRSGLPGRLGYTNGPGGPSTGGLSP